MHRFDATVLRARELRTDPSQGLSGASVEENRRLHGPNRLPEAPERSVASMFLAAVSDKTLLILLGAAGLSIGVEVLRSVLEPGHAPHYIDGIAIFCAVLIAAGVTTLNEARAAAQFRMLSAEREDVPLKILREGHVREVSSYDLVVGDVVYFGDGDKFPADGMLLGGVDVRVDQSLLTGESMHVGKGPEDLELKGGTVVTGGSGSMLVTAVGAESEAGKLQLSLTHGEQDPTPLQQRLGRLADRIGIFGFGAAVLTFAALTGSALVRGELSLEADLEALGVLLRFAIIAVTIVVVAVPEGLPLAVTLSLAYSVRKMARQNNLVRRLASCETMGAATVICSDKTGTLTKNRMSVVDAWLDDRRTGGTPSAEDAGALRSRIVDVAAIDATAFLESDGDLVRYVGNPTECALLAWIAAWGEDWKEHRDAADVLHQIGFTSTRKRMSTLIATRQGPRLLSKGAPDVLLERASRIARPGGGDAPLDAETRSAIGAAIETLSSQGHRALALADRALPAGAENWDDDRLEVDLTLLVLVAIADPVRPEVAAAVAACRRAGVDVKVVTGDNRLTAQAVATEIGLVGPDDIIMDGGEFRGASDEELAPKLDRLRVLARSVPSDKLRLVQLLRGRGDVVAVTGDGTNDAPALHAADVGFSMGRAGTEVAKEASDIVILDDNFASLVTGIQWGRSIFENVRKFLQFQLTVNVVAVTTAFLAAVLGFGVPLNTVQLLWVNLIMDTLAALALATEPPRKDVFDQPPHGRHEPLVTKAMGANIGVTGAYMVAVLALAMWTDLLVPPGTSHAEALTFVFNAFVMMQLFNEINARSTQPRRGVLNGITSNPLFLGVMVATAIAQVVIVQAGGAAFRTVPLDAELWLRSVLAGASVLVVGWLFRAVGRMSSGVSPQRPV